MTLDKLLFLYRCFDLAVLFFSEANRRKASPAIKEAAAKRRTRIGSKRQRDREYLREWRKINSGKCKAYGLAERSKRKVLDRKILDDLRRSTVRGRNSSAQS